MAGYKCTSIGCYSYQSPETNALLQKLQTLTNQFAQVLGFAPLKVDGIIGKGSTEAALLVLTYLSEADQGVLGASAKSIEGNISTPEQLVLNAQPAADIMALASKQKNIASQMTAPAALPAPTPAPSTTQLATTSANAPIKSTSPTVQAKLQEIKATKPALSTSLLDRIPPWASYVSGAALVLGAISIVAYNRKRSARSSSASAPAAVAGWNPSDTRGPRMNPEGLTYYRWWRAAGFTRQPPVNSEQYRAWQHGEDPSDWRAGF